MRDFEEFSNIPGSVFSKVDRVYAEVTKRLVGHRVVRLARASEVAAELRRAMQEQPR